MQNRQCGVCGDAAGATQDHGNGGKYDSGIIVRNYTAGTYVSLTFDVSFKTEGTIQVKMCPYDAREQLTQECFDAHELTTRKSGSDLIDSNGDNLPQTVIVAFPKDVTCQRCVLQWTFSASMIITFTSNLNFDAHVQ